MGGKRRFFAVFSAFKKSDKNPKPSLESPFLTIAKNHGGKERGKKRKKCLIFLLLYRIFFAVRKTHS